MAKNKLLKRATCALAHGAHKQNVVSGLIGSGVSFRRAKRAVLKADKILNHFRVFEQDGAKHLMDFRGRKYKLESN